MNSKLFIELLQKNRLHLIDQFDSWGAKKQFNVWTHKDAITIFLTSGHLTF